MYYQAFQGLKLSALWFGNMRLPTLEDESINSGEADKMIARAYENWVHYYDTAFGIMMANQSYSSGNR
ncbi:MAG: hypothetical protein LBR11_01605 [Deltaproteobacteria bacterium]|jgi:predicted aldo/keto reductase-like oxidoreductase|nr:hypothetical protein [Deltaproteobacteria bacterium]